MDVASALSAFSTSSRRSAFSSSGGKLGSPSGCGIETEGTIRFAPTVREIGTIVHTCTVGMPARSSSLTSVAPQRVHVPHVDVRITAWTPASLSALATC